MKFKSCIKCKSLNPVETKKCHVCNGEDFVPVYLGFEEDIAKKQISEKAEEVNWPELDQKNSEPDPWQDPFYDDVLDESGNRSPYVNANHGENVSKLGKSKESAGDIYLRPLIAAILMTAMLSIYLWGSVRINQEDMLYTQIILGVSLTLIFITSKNRGWLFNKSLIHFIILFGLVSTLIVASAIAFFVYCLYVVANGLGG